MNIIFEKVKNTPLFAGIAYSDFEKLYSCLSARTARYKKGGIILLSGNTLTFVGLILSGSVKIIKEDMNGNISILTELSEGQMFGEVLAYTDITQSPVTVQATADCEILLINNIKMINICSAACTYHIKLIENIVKMIAKKNFIQNRKIEILSKRTTREKLLAFFDFYRKGMNKFTVPYNREEMADYLCVDRSAMSGELSRMKKEGLIDYYKNEFIIKQI